MNKLPNELICMILSHLYLIDLIDNCRLVSKRWLALVGSIKFKQLVIKDFNFGYNNRWSYTLEGINPNFIFYINECDLFESLKVKLKIKTLEIKFSNFSNIKRLKIHFSRVYLDIEKLNDFIQLEHLELIGISYNKNSTLSLPNLRVLHLTNRISIRELIINTAKLEVLSFDRLSCINLVHPQSVKYINQIDINKTEDLNEFINLKVFRANSNHLDRDLSSKLPNSVEELYFDCYWSFRNLNNYLDYLLELKKIRSKLKIYFLGIEFPVNMPLILNGSTHNWLELFHSNYEKITTLPSSDLLMYDELMKEFNKIIPDDFHSKLINIKEVHAKKIENQDQFIWFLKGSNLNNLYLHNSSLNQQFYNGLPKIASSLINFDFDEKAQTIQIDFKFISEFKMLSSFRTNQDIPVQLAINLIKNTKFLIQFRFMNNNRRVIAEKNPRIPAYFIRIMNTDIKQIASNNEELDEIFANQKFFV